MHIKSIVAGAAIALAAATGLASANDELSPQGGDPAPTPTFGPNSGSAIFDLTNENPGVKYMEGGRMMDDTPYIGEHGVEDDGMGWILFGDPAVELEPSTTPTGFSTPTAPDPNAAKYRVKFTMFPFPKISIDGSTVDKSLGKRTIRIKLPSGKFVTEEITIMQTEDGKIYGVGAGLHNFGPMHESRNQPFPGQTQYSFDEDPIPRPVPTPGSQMSETDQQNMEQGPSSGENFDHFQCNHISTPHPGDEICILSLR